MPSFYKLIYFPDLFDFSWPFLLILSQDRGQQNPAWASRRIDMPYFIVNT